MLRTSNGGNAYRRKPAVERASDAALDLALAVLACAALIALLAFPVAGAVIEIFGR